MTLNVDVDCQLRCHIFRDEIDWKFWNLFFGFFL